MGMGLLILPGLQNTTAVTQEMDDLYEQYQRMCDQIVFAAAVPTHSHIARAPTAVARVQALVDGGVISPGSMWVKTGAVAINGWQALSAHDGIVAAEAKAAAAKALAKAGADLVVITKAEGLLSAQFSPAAAAAPSPPLVTASAVAKAHWRRRPF